jgi:hypothetical protein
MHKATPQVEEPILPHVLPTRGIFSAGIFARRRIVSTNLGFGWWKTKALTVSRDKLQILSRSQIVRSMRSAAARANVAPSKSTTAEAFALALIRRAAE